MLTYDEVGYAIQPDAGFCGCGCGNKHDHNTYRMWRGSVWWFKFDRYPNQQSHVQKWLDTRIKDVSDEQRELDV